MQQRKGKDGEREIAQLLRDLQQLVKDITGGDTLEGRRLYQEAFTFKPQFKPWMYGNHEPDSQAALPLILWMP